VSAITFADIEAAAERLAGQAVLTPLIESPALNDRLGMRVLIKPETLQRVGAFKFRGAFNRLSQVAPADRPRGVVAFSSGNHAQGVALAARLLDMPAVIVMPADAPAVKVEATRGYGAEVVFYDRMTESREAIAARLAGERGAVMVPAYDDPDIIAGQGTAGLELARQAQDLGAELDLVVGPVGGGGLMAGVALAVQTLSPRTRIVGVEPELYDDARRSLASGRRESAVPTVRTLCDSLETPSTGELTFPILQQRLAAIVTVSDAEVAAAVRLAFSTLKLTVEPGGAVGLAALMAGRVPEARPGACVGLVLSGGNVDPDLFARVLRGEF
jgi:threonine dehydratase